MSRRNRIGAEWGGLSFEYGGPGGKLVENDFLGGVRPARDELGDADTYQPYKEAMDYVREHQKGDPGDPEGWFANDLHATIADKLGLEDYSQLRFYTAVGSKLDTYHGVDGFFEFQPDPESPDDVVRVTVDVTTNPEKTDYKADVIIQVPGDGIDPTDPDDKKILARLLSEYSDEIAAKFRPYVKTEAA